MITISGNPLQNDYSITFFEGGGVPQNDYNWLHRGRGVWKNPKIDYVILEQPLRNQFLSIFLENFRLRTRQLERIRTIAKVLVQSTCFNIFFLKNINLDCLAKFKIHSSFDAKILHKNVCTFWDNFGANFYC